MNTDSINPTDIGEIFAEIAAAQPGLPDSLRMRPLQKDDLVRIEPIVKSIWSVGYAKRSEEVYGMLDKPWQERAWNNIRVALESGDRLVFVVETNGHICAFSTAKTDDPNVATLSYNGVAEEYQGLGIGRLQLQAILELLKRSGYRFVEVGTGLNDGHAPARRLYEKLGFRELSRAVTYYLPLE